MLAWRSCLLAVLCVTAGCAATQQQQQPSAVSSTTTNEVLDLIARAVRTELRPLLSRLESRMDALDNRLVLLDSRVDELTVRLFEHSQSPHPGDLSDRLDSQQAQLDQLVTTLSSQQSLLAKLTDSNNKKLDGVANETASLQIQIDGLAVRLDQVEEMTKPGPRDCSDLPAGATTGVHIIWPGLGHLQSPVKAFCDMDTAGGNWTVFQRRDNIRPRQNFFLGWASYKRGFGILTKEFWWGLEHLWTMTSVQDRQYELRIDLEDLDGNKRYAVYQGFRISSEEDGYRLSASNFTGDATHGLRTSVNQKFSTPDRDQDGHDWIDCAERRQGPWWYGDCGLSCLNGPYLERGDGDGPGILWWTWKRQESLKSSEMKIRPI